ncbi:MULTISPECIES: GNAT family N-acetyltransferase [unclassified Streptomyces]|uniref:GNAT family N-acetyltransferase n=1 Tax=unclassified Streptomyces TaxID=2593676 RepID=UPI002DDB3E88|nr:MULTISPECIES: GNAT family N-acetyltransferase [unclassified Streptomyces]WSA90345.1 GNAT family N-acetyltransferase [Streptomyces sp. NBC_01795]WSB74571.1 GNAT family N-acetyltransferase [Streptomyces sp. NBC_01775]WSS17044.1 GNAT family N-acetyltransferase [Streptomyces sp. NBC_01186]WSS45787.1 GNAT family N-acetyltransferase [Streptomyces sp. NBC_01187]
MTAPQRQASQRPFGRRPAPRTRAVSGTRAWPAGRTPPAVRPAPDRPPGPGSPAAPAAADLAVTVCRDPERFAALAQDWTALHRRCPSATAFQSHAWLHSWWLSYGTPGRLRVVLVHQGGELIAAAALTLIYRPLPALVPLGGDISDFCDVLLDDSCAPQAAVALVRGMRKAARGSVVDLREVRPGAAAEQVYARWRGPRRRLPDSACLELPGVPVEGLVARLSGRAARTFRAKLRKLDKLSIEERAVPPAEVPAAVAALLRLHGLQWRGRGVTPEHLRPRFAEHLARAATGMVRAGDARLIEYRVEGRVMALDLTLLSADLAGGYLSGAHPELRSRKVDITAMLLRHDARYVSETGRGALSMLRGTEPYKRHLRPVTVTNQRLLLARPVGLPVLLAQVAHAAARSAAAELVRTRLPAVRRWRSRLNSRRADAAGARRACRAGA